MSQLEMTGLVNMVRSFEAVGDNAVIQKFESGKMGPHDVVAGTDDPQAKVDAALVKDVLAQIRDTKGMGQAQVKEAERLFGEIMADASP